ncbi:DUF1801 domain-containing protein [Niveispirillum sp. KHB5.9]|uniref:DUF1801 domain-containing protein n=1 Tax=Niveispirillum sp. KHB5.9 TaxID=3400269 RepID=UPI003A839D01
MPPKAYKSVEEFLSDLSDESLAVTEGLRTLIKAAHPGLVEQVKWNAPSFSLDGTDLITLGVERDGSIRLVLHRGAKVKDSDGFRFDDPSRLARWPSPDRGVVVVKDADGLAAKITELSNLIKRWVAAATA